MQKTSIFKFRKWLKLLWNRGRGGFSIFGDSSQLLWIFLPFFGGFPKWKNSKSTLYLGHPMSRFNVIMVMTSNVMFLLHQFSAASAFRMMLANFNNLIFYCVRSQMYFPTLGFSDWIYWACNQLSHIRNSQIKGNFAHKT